MTTTEISHEEICKFFTCLQSVISTYLPTANVKKELIKSEGNFTNFSSPSNLDNLMLNLLKDHVTLSYPSQSARFKSMVTPDNKFLALFISLQNENFTKQGNRNNGFGKQLKKIKNALHGDN